MSGTYFRRVRTTTPTRLWINNPSSVEIGLAMAEGAVGCTTNPTFAGNRLRREPDDTRAVVGAALTAIPDADDEAVANLVQQQLVARVAERFLPLHERSEGLEGYVSIQGSPLSDDDGVRILEEAQSARAIGPNVTPKIPATLPGLEAFEALVEAGSPTIVTEVFSLAQLAEANERYLRVAARTGHRPPFFVSPITGIFGDHLRARAESDGLSMDEGTLRLAGVALARRCNDLVEERGYPSVLLFGGARIVEDFTGLVGAATAATINYSTVAEILALEPQVEDSIHQPMPSAVIDALAGGFEDFRRAWMPDGLRPAEFEAFGPVQHFRANFVAGWRSVLDSIAEARATMRVGAR